LTNEDPDRIGNGRSSPSPGSSAPFFQADAEPVSPQLALQPPSPSMTAPLTAANCFPKKNFLARHPPPGSLPKGRLDDRHVMGPRAHPPHRRPHGRVCPPRRPMEDRLPPHLTTQGGVLQTSPPSRLAGPSSRPRTWRSRCNTSGLRTPRPLATPLANMAEFTSVTDSSVALLDHNR